MDLRVLPAVVLLTTVALIAFGVARLIEPIQLANMSDWMSYHNGAARLVLDGSPYSDMQFSGYKLDQAAWGRGFVYPPPAAFLLFPTLLGTWTFWAINAGAVVFIGVSALIAVREGLPWYMCALVAALAFAQPGLAEIREGQLSPWIASAIGLMWLRKSAAGWLSVLAGLIKVYPLLGLLWAYRQRAGLRGPLALALLSVVVLFPLWLEWVAVMSNAHAGCPSISLPSFTCTAGAAWPGYVAAAALAVVALRVRSDRVAFLALSLAMIASAPDIYVGYLLIVFVGLLPTLTLLLGKIAAIRNGNLPQATVDDERSSPTLPRAFEDITTS